MKGLEVDAGVTHAQKILFQLGDKRNPDALGGVYPTDGLRRIFYASSLLHESAQEVANVVGHEAVHLLQLEKTYWKSSNPIIAAIINCHPYIRIYQRFKSTQPEKIAQKFLNKEYSYLRRSVRGDIAELKYQNQAVEIQARLHEIMADGYQRWGKLPQNPQELMDALIATGIINDSPDSQSSSSIFKEKTSTASSAARDVARLIKNIYFSRENKSEFTKIILPSLYVNLLELYGDKNARQRFDLDKNYRPIKQETKQTIPVATPSLA